MMDSGASLHAGSLKKHFPGLLLRISEGQKRGDYALTANGGKLYNNGEFTVKGTCDGVNMSLNFTHMDVDLPVASVRQFVKSGYEVTFNEEGGKIRDPKSKAKVSFIAMGGVFFLKLKLPPQNNEAKNKTPFGRQGP